MTKVPNCLRVTHPIKASVLLALALAAMLVAGRVDAACTVVFSVSNVQMGNVSVPSLRTSSVPGYRLMGAKNQNVNVACTVPQATLRLELNGLTPVIGKPLVRWGSVGAMQVHALGASVGGVAVNVKLESLMGSVYVQSVDVTKNDVLVFDLSNVPVRERTSFSVQLQLLGLLPESYIVNSQVVLDSSISVRVLDAQ